MRVLVLLLALVVVPASSLTPSADDVYVRVVDVGSGLCTITKMPGEHYMIYDVEIILSNISNVKVAYREVSAGC